MQRLLILHCFMLVLSSPAITQPAGNSHVQVYTTDNGLPSNGIKGLQWDERTGFLWIATEAGIVRFNGVDFHSYTKENMPSIASERMLFIVRNNAGKIYLSDQPGNIFFIDKSRPVHWRQAASNNTINPALGNYFLLSVSDRFFLAHAGRQTHSVFSSGINKIISISDTSCLILSQGVLFFHSIGLKHPVILPVEKGNINTVFRIGDSYFINSNKNRVSLLNINDYTLAPVSIETADGIPLNTTNGNLFFYWETGMSNPVYIEGGTAWLLKYNGAAITAELVFTGIPVDSYIRSVQYSAANKLFFIGTESKGLIVINQNRVESKKRNEINSKNRNSYYSQVELSNGNILTNESDIIGDNKTTTAALPIKGKFDFFVSETNGIFLWYNQVEPRLGYTCLHQYNKLSGQTKVYDKIRSGDLVAASGTIIYLANPFGIGILESDSLRYLFKYPKEIAGAVLFDFKEISPGMLGIATCGGLFRFNTSSLLLETIFTKPNICVRSLWKYKDYIFFGTYGSGFYIYKNGVVKSMPLDKNRYLLYAHCFVPDNNGYCWISTNRGLFKCSLAALIDVFDNNIRSVYYHYFGKKDGMEMTELNGGCTPCALRLKSNIISFPSMDGLLWVNPTEAVPVFPEGDIFIDNVVVDNEIKDLLSFTQKSLPFKTGEIIFRLAFSAWCNKENIYLEYQLNDSLHWKPLSLGNESEIRFNNLSPGKYTLRIRKLNGFGVDNYTYKKINFSITTPWHQQWWFYLLCVAVMFGLVALYLRIRTRQYKTRQRNLEQQVKEKTKELLEQNEILEKNNTIKTRLISIISHDIVTPLKFLTVAGKNLLEKRKLMPEDLQQETIREITNTSQELQLLSTNILNWIKYQNENRRLTKETFDIYELVNQVLGILNSLARQKGLHIVNEIEKELTVYQFYEPLKILVYNLLTNAINFSEKGTIKVSAAKTDTDVVVSVQDEGVGMTQEKTQSLLEDHVVISSANVDNRKGHGLGFLIIKDLVKMMGASLDIKSEKGYGTTVSIHMLVKK